MKKTMREYSVYVWPKDEYKRYYDYAKKEGKCSERNSGLCIHRGNRLENAIAAAQRISSNRNRRKYWDMVHVLSIKYPEPAKTVLYFRLC